MPLRASAACAAAVLLAGVATGSAAPPPGDRPPIFVDATASSGLDFAHANGMTGGLHLPEIMGPGAALADLDNDGDLDLLLVQGSPLDAKGQSRNATGELRVFRNELRKQAHFSDVTEAFGLRAEGYGMGLAVGDFDNDGYVDVLVTGYGKDRLFRNDAGHRLVDVSDRLGTQAPGWSVSATFFDYDRDGWLDLFIGRYVQYEPRPCFLASTRRDYCGPKAFAAQAERLLHNRGDGTFEDVTEAMLGPHAPSPALGVVAFDANDDGWLDLYVTNDGAPNRLWINQKGRGFRESGLLAGVALDPMGHADGSMGVDAGDVDGDGRLDLLVTNLAGEGTALYVGTGAAQFEDRRASSGLGVSSLPLTGFGAAFLDYDNDGRLDVVTVNGAVHFVDSRPPTRADPLPLGEPKQLYRGMGAGRFENVSAQAGPAFLRSAVSRGLAVGDVDNDGDPDLLVADANGPARLLLNRIGQTQPWLGLRVKDGARDGLGALVRLLRKDGTDLWRRVHTDGSYASAGDPRVLFGLGGGTVVRAIEIHWVDGTVETFDPPPLRRYTTLAKGHGRR